MFHVKRNVLGMVGCAAMLHCAGLVSAQEWYFDLNGDGIEEHVVSEPWGEGNNVASGVGGQVTVFWGHSGNQMVRFVSEVPDDEFGFAVTAIQDINGDGFIDMIIGAPGNNRLYIYEGPWTTALDDPVVATRASYEIRDSFHVTRFGQDLAPLFDGDGDGVNDFQVACQFADTNGNLMTRIYFYSGAAGVPIASVDLLNSFGKCPSFFGDTNGDAKNSSADLDVIVNNLGLTNATRKEGDLTGDGNVSSDDFLELIEYYGDYGYQLVASSVENCPSETGQDGLWLTAGDMGIGCYTPLMSAPVTIQLSLNSLGEIEFTQNELLTTGLPMYSNQCVLWPNCISSQVLEDALLDMQQSCTGSGIQLWLTITCGPCKGESLPFDGSRAWPVCTGTDASQGEIIGFRIHVCTDLPFGPNEDFCSVIAHEITHIRNYCNAGFAAPGMSCEEFARFWNAYNNRMCSELSAFKSQGICLDESGNVDFGCLCSRYCLYYFWQGAQGDCLMDCLNHAGTCCDLDLGFWLYYIEGCNNEVTY